MNGYRLLSYRVDGGEPRAGLLLGDRVLDLLDDTGLGCVSVLDLLRQWDDARGLLSELAGSGRGGGVGTPLRAVELTAPILYPGAIFGAGANYADHIREMRGQDPPDKKDLAPFFFLKTSAHSVIGPEEPIHLPAFSRQVDWEAEIGAVIGRPARDLPVEEALECVAGYLIVNDLSARDAFRRQDTPFALDWLGQKCFDGACPMGPWITPAEQVPDPQALGIRLWLNGELMQDSSSRQMIFGVAEQIAWLSRHLTLRPGDVISTGTPAGVGSPRGIFLKPGDRVRIAIDGLGELSNPVADD